MIHWTGIDLLIIGGLVLVAFCFGWTLGIQQLTRRIDRELLTRRLQKQNRKP